MEEQKVPGPGEYEAVGDVADQYQAVYRSIQARRFPKCPKPEWTSKFETPGAGTYVPPSTFGYLTVSPRNSRQCHKKSMRIYNQKLPTLRNKN